MDNVFKYIAKMFSWGAGITALTLVIFRGIVGYLLASRSDFGVMGAFVIGFFGFLLIIYLLMLAFNSLKQLP